MSVDKIPTNQHMVTAYAFDDFVLNVALRNLRFRDTPVSITPKAYQTLVLLIRDHGKVVDKEEFLQEIWPDTFVEESTLAQNILTLRKALARYNRSKEFIVTVPRRGYRFVEKVEEITSAEVTLLVGQSEKRELRSVKISPDGKKLACSLWDAVAKRMVLALISADTRTILSYPITPESSDIPFVDWSVDGKTLYAVVRRNKPVSLWRIPVYGGEPVQLCEWKNELSIRLAISVNGQSIFYDVGID